MKCIQLMLDRLHRFMPLKSINRPVFDELRHTTTLYLSYVFCVVVNVFYIGRPLLKPTFVDK
jgi:hypothetical protein